MSVHTDGADPAADVNGLTGAQGHSCCGGGHDATGIDLQVAMGGGSALGTRSGVLRDTGAPLYTGEEGGMSVGDGVFHIDRGVPSTGTIQGGGNLPAGGDDTIRRSGQQIKLAATSGGGLRDSGSCGRQCVLRAQKRRQRPTQGRQRRRQGRPAQRRGLPRRSCDRRQQRPSMEHDRRWQGRWRARHLQPRYSGRHGRHSGRRRSRLQCRWSGRRGMRTPKHRRPHLQTTVHPPLLSTFGTATAATSGTTFQRGTGAQAASWWTGAPTMVATRRSLALQQQWMPSCQGACFDAREAPA
jgi:hypothetical protein